MKEKWMLFAYFYYAQFSFMKLASSFLGFLFLIVIAVKELFPVVFRFGTAFFNVATFRTADLLHSYFVNTMLNTGDAIFGTTGLKVEVSER